MAQFYFGNQTIRMLAYVFFIMNANTSKKNKTKPNKKMFE